MNSPEINQLEMTENSSGDPLSFKFSCSSDEIITNDKQNSIYIKIYNFISKLLKKR